MEWDFFLAHASADSDAAGRLRSLLEGEATVFEDSMLHAGEDWDVALDRHLRASTMIVVLVSSLTASSHYQREEIARAITLTRGDATRRVVPLLLEPVDVAALPYGLAIKTCVRLSDNLDLAGAARVLLASLRDLRATRGEGPSEAAADIGAVLSALDATALTGDRSELLLTALNEVGDSEALARHLRKHGLDARVVLPALPGHDDALARWLPDADNVPNAADLPGVVRRLLLQHLVEERNDLSASAAATRAEVLKGPIKSQSARQLVTALASALPPLPSTVGTTLLASAEAPAQPEILPPLHRTALAMMALPKREPLLVGREELVTDLVAQIGASLADRGSATVFLTGLLGAGISTVAIETARALTGHFPGGTRYVDLRGLNEESRRGDIDVAKLVCHSFGEIPSPGSTLEQYRVLLNSREVLLVLDNALDAKHVANLMPTPPSCGIIVTSRNRTQSYADPRLVVHVPSLARVDSMLLLSSVRSSNGKDDLPLDQIAQACADLPMALRLVAAWIMNHPETSLTSLARQLSVEKTRLEYLDDGVVAMRSAIDLSYQQLDVDTRQAFRFLAAVPNSATTAASLGRGLERAPGLMELTLYRLVDRSIAACEERTADRIPMFRLFELVRLYALERLEQEDSPEVVARFQWLLINGLLETIISEQEPSPALRLDPTPLVAARTIAEREHWFDLAADLTDSLRVLHEAELDHEAVRRDHRRAAELRRRQSDVVQDGVLPGPTAQTPTRKPRRVRAHRFHRRKSLVDVSRRLPSAVFIVIGVVVAFIVGTVVFRAAPPAAPADAGTTSAPDGTWAPGGVLTAFPPSGTLPGQSGDGGSMEFSGHTGAVTAVDFMSNGRLLASASTDHRVLLWDVTNPTRPTRQQLTGHTDSVNDVAFSPNGRLLATASADKTVQIWDMATGQSRALTGHTNTVFGVAFSPDGRLLATASADQTVRIWDMATGRPRGGPLAGHTETVFGVAFSPDGRLLATASADSTVRLWDMATGTPHGGALAGHTDWVYGVAFNRDGRLLATASADSTVRLWDVATGQSSGGPLAGHTGPVYGVAFSPDAALLATASADRTVRLWDVATGQSHGGPLAGHTDSVNDVAFSPDGRLLASASADRTVRLWKRP